MTREVEDQLRELLTKFGEKKVRSVGPADYEMQMERLAMRGKRDPSDSSSEMSRRWLRSGYHNGRKWQCIRD